MVTRLEPDEIPDETLRAYASKQKDRSVFYRIALAVNFRPARSETFVDAGVGLRLDHDGSADVPPPIARSLDPLRLSGSSTRRTTTGVVANIAVGQARAERTTESPDGRAYLVAAGDGRCDPAWSFDGSAGHELRGIYPLTMVAEAPAGPHSVALLAASATIRRPVAGFLRCRAALPRELEIIDLGG